MGYNRAGFDEIVGVDIAPQPRYPFEFVQADALEYLAEHGHEFDAIHASPPCQRWTLSTLSKGYAWAMTHPDLITPLRPLLESHRFTIIENVPRAPIRRDLVLTGPTVGLSRIERRRHFELSVFLLQPPLQHVPSWMWESGQAITVTTSLLPGKVPVSEAREVMGIDWPMTGREVGEAIPPAYTEFIGRQLLKVI